MPENPPLDPTAFRVLNEINIIAQISSNLLERALPDDMKMAHFVVLNHFVRLGGDRTPQELARAFQVTKGAMTNTIQRLEAHGFVSVVPDKKDQRVKRISITPAGIAARQAAIIAVEPILAALTERFSAADLENLLPTLQEMRSWFGTQRNDL